MRCHECARGLVDEAAVGHCRFCLVGLCKDHLVSSFRPAVVPQYTCEHHPDLHYADRPNEQAGSGLRARLSEPSVMANVTGRIRRWLGERPFRQIGPAERGRAASKATNVAQIETHLPNRSQW